MNFFQNEYETRELNYEFPEDLFMANKLLDDDYDNYFNDQSYTTKRSNSFELSLVEKQSS